MHVALRRHQRRVPGELLDHSCRNTAHGEMTTKRVTQSMRAVYTQLGGLERRLEPRAPRAVVIGKSSAFENTNGPPLRLRAASAAASRLVMGTVRILSCFGVVNWPLYSEHSTVISRRRRSTDAQCKPRISPARSPASPPSRTNAR
jgi:hypothetical protein